MAVIDWANTGKEAALAAQLTASFPSYQLFALAIPAAGTGLGGSRPRRAADVTSRRRTISLKNKEELVTLVGSRQQSRSLGADD